MDVLSPYHDKAWKSSFFDAHSQWNEQGIFISIFYLKRLPRTFPVGDDSVAEPPVN